MQPNEDHMAEITEESLKEAIEALKGAGYQVLTKDQMSDRLRQATKEIGPLKARLDELEKQYTTATKSLRAYEDKDKSAEQRIADELQAKQDTIDAWAAKHEKQLQATAQEQQRSKDMFLQNKLHDMLGKSVNPGAAVKLAMAELDGLGVDIDDSGKFALTYTGPDKLPGDAAEAVTGWYREQSVLHPPAGDGVPASTVNPPSGGNSTSNWDNLDAESRVERAFFPSS
jgi:biotin operon repressor